jgi:transposase
LLELRHAQAQREPWQSLIAQEVLGDAELASTVRLCGVRQIVAFALEAFIGDIKRVAEPKKPVKYCGLDPAFDDSVETEWSGAIGGHGNKYVRCLLIEAAHSILRGSQSPLAKWGKWLLPRKGEISLVVAATPRRLTVAVCHLMNGRWTRWRKLTAAWPVRSPG